MDGHTFDICGEGWYSYLSCKGITTDNYIAMMSEIGQPLDEIAIVLVARMYHIHIAIIQDNMYWTTRRDHNIVFCKVVFGWQGKLKFIDIKRKVDQLVLVYNLRNAKYPDPNVPLLPASPQRPFGPEPS